MCYGGSGGSIGGTVNVDIVQTDVQAIVDGLTGWNGNTLSDLNYHLSNIDGALYNVDSVAWLLTFANENLEIIKNHLFDDYSSRSVAEILVSMESILNDIR